MYFQLLFGKHLEKEKQYSVTIERDDQGIPHITAQPIIESDRDLVVAFGSEKFKRIPDSEIKSLLVETSGQTTSQSTSPDVSNKEAVEKAVKRGSAGIAEPPGVDVTNKFPEIQNGKETQFSFRVYFKRGKGYFIGDGVQILTEVPLKREEVANWIKAYVEG